MITDMHYGASPKLFRIARTLRRNMTESEQVLWKRLQDKSLIEVKFRRQHPIYKYIVDFYCHKHKLIIELDGNYHLKPDQKLFDGFRDEKFNKFGLTVLRFTDDQVLSDVDIVINQILNQIRGSM